MDMLDKDFIYFDSSGEERQVHLTEKDFKQVNVDKKIHDVKFKTKPTTFFKDAFKRFCKNKSSVAGGIILGILVLFAIFVPLTVAGDVNQKRLDMQFIYPKLFNNADGFWDGTYYVDTPIPFDYQNNTPAGYSKNAVSELKTWDVKTNTANAYASGGYLILSGDKATNSSTTKYLESYTFSMDTAYQYSISFETDYLNYGSGVNAPYNIYLKYTDYETKQVRYVNYFDDYVTTTGEQEISLTDLATKGNLSPVELNNVNVGIRIELNDTSSSKIFIKYLNTYCSNEEDNFNNYGFKDGNQGVLVPSSTTSADSSIKVDNVNYWASNGSKELYDATITYCNFRYDTYEAKLGYREGISIPRSTINQYISNGWMEYSFLQGPSSFKVLDPEKCPVLEVTAQKDETGVVNTTTLICNVTYYKYLGYDTMPKFIFGTDYLGRDMFKYIFVGLGTSLLIGLVVAVVNMFIGVIWGSISGYYGGWVDLTMERITDILGRIPWLVIMTLCILFLGQNFGTFALALCLTGWIGISATTRAQFYRFKGREYVLASRTLGARDRRLIFRHILPNALGTLVTSCVFLIPSTIFSEASISYLGLGLQGMSSFGVILSNNQQYLQSQPYLILIPSVIMALMMIAFNLFGNGLRDAFNPSLKGSD